MVYGMSMGGGMMPMGYPGSANATGGLNPAPVVGGGYTGGLPATNAVSPYGGTGSADALGGGGMAQSILPMLAMLLQILTMLMGSGGAGAGGENPFSGAAGNEDAQNGANQPKGCGNHGGGEKPGGNEMPGGTEKPGGAEKPGSTEKPGGTEKPGMEGGSTPSKTGNQQMDQWDADIEAASKETGVPANLIKSTIYSESSGRPEVSTQNVGGWTDHSLMQTSNENYYGRVTSQMPDAPTGLDAANPKDNIRMGAWTLKAYIEIESGGNIAEGLGKYVGVGDTGAYANKSYKNYQNLNNGQPLVDG